MGCLPYNRLSNYLFLEELRQAEGSRAFREAHRCSALEGDVEQTTLRMGATRENTPHQNRVGVRAFFTNDHAQSCKHGTAGGSTAP